MTLDYKSDRYEGMESQRHVEIWTMDGWQDIEMSELKVGDLMRSFEITGEQVTLTSGGATEGIVSRPPAVGEYGVYEVEIYEGHSW